METGVWGVGPYEVQRFLIQKFDMQQSKNITMSCIIDVIILDLKIVAKLKHVVWVCESWVVSACESCVVLSSELAWGA